MYQIPFHCSLHQFVRELMSTVCPVVTVLWIGSSFSSLLSLNLGERVNFCLCGPMIPLHTCMFLIYESINPQADCILIWGGCGVDVDVGSFLFLLFLRAHLPLPTGTHDMVCGWVSSPHHYTHFYSLLVFFLTNVLIFTNHLVSLFYFGHVHFYVSKLFFFFHFV